MSMLLSLAHPVSRSSLERLYRARQSHPNPLSLTSPESAIYAGNGPRQSHFSYLQCFQGVSLEKRAFFSKKIVARAPAALASPVEAENRYAKVPGNRRRVWPVRVTVTVSGLFYDFRRTGGSCGRPPGLGLFQAAPVNCRLLTVKSLIYRT